MLDSENRGAAHAVQGFINHIAVLLVKGSQQFCVATDQQWWTAFRELGGKQFLVAVPDAPRLIDYQGTGIFNALEC